jgi:uroporphyrinogen decarboxylase
MPPPLSHADRLRTILAGRTPDRTPVALWRHWPGHDQSGPSLARHTLAFQHRHDFDFVKLCPASNYPVAAWGGHSDVHDSPVGTRRWLRRAVLTPDHWLALRPQNPHAGLPGQLLSALRLVRSELPPDTPLVLTVFNPLAQARYLAGEDTLLHHLATAPEAVQAGLRVIAESTARFVEEAVLAGADGIFLAVQHSGPLALGEAAYRRLGTPGDLAVLAPARDCWLNILHLHGSDPLFALADEYPVAAINWHSAHTLPSLAQAATATRKTLCAGLDENGPLRRGTPDQTRAATLDALGQTAPGRLILSAGCVLPLDTPETNIAAVRSALDHPS